MAAEHFSWHGFVRQARFLIGSCLASWGRAESLTWDELPGRNVKQGNTFLAKSLGCIWLSNCKLPASCLLWAVCFGLPVTPRRKRHSYGLPSIPAILLSCGGCFQWRAQIYTQDHKLLQARSQKACNSKLIKASQQRPKQRLQLFRVPTPKPSDTF